MNYLCFDVGGTVLKYASVVNGNRPVIHTRPAKSKADRNTVLANFYGAIDELVNTGEDIFDGICFAFPGDFDYENGISLIQGVDKYESLYGVNLKTCFSDYIFLQHKKRISKGFTCTFINDVSAVAAGCINTDNRLKQGNVLTLCIGTGCGSAFCSNGNMITKGPGLPENGWVYPLPFAEKTFDDYLSLRGFKELSKNRLGTAYDSLQVSQRIKAGDEQALGVMRTFGAQIAQGLSIICTGFKPDYVVLGGGIMNSYSYLAPAIESLAGELNFEVIPVPNTSELAIQGLAVI